MSTELTALEQQRRRDVEYLQSRIDYLMAYLYGWRVVGEKLLRDGLTVGNEQAVAELLGEKE